MRVVAGIIVGVTAFLGLLTWQVVLLLTAISILVLGLATFMRAGHALRILREIQADQEARIDALGRKRPDRLRES